MTDAEARVRQAVRELRYDFRRFTMPGFMTYLAQVRQRDIILRGVPFEGRLHGLWVRADTADYLFYDRRTHPVHQVHHILHEVGHLVLAHPPHDLAAALLPVGEDHLSSPLGSHCRGRDLHESPTEREAEWFARYLQRDILLAGRLAALARPVLRSALCPAITGLRQYVRLAALERRLAEQVNLRREPLAWWQAGQPAVVEMAIYVTTINILDYYRQLDRADPLGDTLYARIQARLLEWEDYDGLVEALCRVVI